MQNEKLTATEACDAELVRTGVPEMLAPHGFYVATCYDKDGNVKWTDTIHNIVTTVGKNDLLDKYLSGSAYTAAPFMGLKGTGTAVAGDTQASHATWSEVGGANAPAYSGTRKTPTFGAAAAGVKATSAAVNFTFTSGGTVAGAFINMGGASAIDNTTGVLFSAGDFTGGNKTVAATDQLNVTWQLSA